MNCWTWFYSLKRICKVVGKGDFYGKGKVSHISFISRDFVVVWVEYKHKTVGYNAWWLC